VDQHRISVTFASHDVADWLVEAVIPPIASLLAAFAPRAMDIDSRICRLERLVGVPGTPRGGSDDAARFFERLERVETATALLLKSPEVAAYVTAGKVGGGGRGRAPPSNSAAPPCSGPIEVRNDRWATYKHGGGDAALATASPGGFIGSTGVPWGARGPRAAATASYRVPVANGAGW